MIEVLFLTDEAVESDPTVGYRAPEFVAADRYECVALLDPPADRYGHLNPAELAFQLCQNVDWCWSDELGQKPWAVVSPPWGARGTRSMMVGDVVRVDSQALLCAPAGFREVQLA